MNQIRFTRFDGGSFDAETGLNTGGTIADGAGFYGLPSGDNIHPISTDDPRHISATDPALTVADVLDQIDTAAEQGRLQHITPGDGQAMTYREKVREVATWLFDHDGTAANADNFPLLYAEAAARSLSVDAVATEIHINAGLWGGVIGPAIEGTRVAAKDAAKAQGADLQSVLDQALADLATQANPATHAAALAAMQASRTAEAVANGRGV